MSVTDRVYSVYYCCRVARELHPHPLHLFGGARQGANAVTGGGSKKGLRLSWRRLRAIAAITLMVIRTAELRHCGRELQRGSFDRVPL